MTAHYTEEELTPAEIAKLNRDNECRTSLGMVPRTSYKDRSENRLEALEIAVRDWLAFKPGHFIASGSSGFDEVYDRAFKRFLNRTGFEKAERADFEIALSREGYRAGVCVSGRREVWLLLLPNRMD